MSFGPASLLATLTRLERQNGAANRLIIALSGGLDSVVLADILCRTAADHGKDLRAVHVNHGLQPQSDDFVTHCRAFAESRSLAIDCIAVEVDLDAGKGLEAAAREARYSALADLMQPGDWLLSAHHEDDQAETLLLNLLRGSGPLGVAAMPAIRRLAEGWLVRPLLDVPRAELERYAKENDLEWSEDPSNDDSTLDRNFLRREVLPRIAERWPDGRRRLARSASLARDAADLLDDLAELDCGPITNAEGRCSVAGLAALPGSRQRNALRKLARDAAIAAPGASHLEQIVTTLLDARDDAVPVVSWPGGEARRFRDSLYLMPPLDAATLAETAWSGARPLSLGHGLGRLSLARVDHEALDPALLRGGLTVRPRRGGEQIRIESQGPTRKLKKLLNEQAIVPWMRDRLPLLFSGERLVAVADLWIAADARAEPGLAVRWERAPLLF